MERLRTYLSGRTYLVVIIALGLALGVSLTADFFGRDVAYAIDQKTVENQRAALRDLQEGFTSLVEEMLPSVVSITSRRTVETRRTIPWFDEEFFRDFPFRIPRPDVPDREQRESYGSGVIVRSDGYILTNDHVVGGADKVMIALKDGREFEGTVSRDPRSDLALIKIDATGLPAAKLGDSNNVKVGSWAIAVGSPFGLAHTVTIGVISGMGRQGAVADREGSARFYPNLIQTDASINPGNSGGPLVNLDGEVIGINTLIRSSLGGGNIGIGFAIPVNTAKFVLDQLIAHGKVTRGYLGIRPADLTPTTAERYGVKEGALVQSVEVGTPADKSGVQVEDVVVEFDGKEISGEIDLREVIAATPPGKEVNMVVIRDKNRKTLKVTLEEPPSLEAADPPKTPDSKLGFSVADITPDMAEKFKLDTGVKGVVVTTVAPGSSAMRAGLEPGHVITHVNVKRVTTCEELNNATKDLESGSELSLRVRTKERVLLLEFTLD